jgi:rare lipoprotein A
MKAVLVCALLLMAGAAVGGTKETPARGVASWYGEQHRGWLMANGKPFNPDKLTAASWFYPLGAHVRVSLRTGNLPCRTVIVRITDRGPAQELVRQGRIIDLSRAAFQRVGRLETGLVPITVEPLKSTSRHHTITTNSSSSS